MVHDESHNVACRDGESSWRARDVRVVTASRDGVLYGESWWQARFGDTCHQCVSMS